MTSWLAPRDAQTAPKASAWEAARLEDARPLILSNGEIEVMVATTFGPRVLGYRMKGGRNAFGFVPDEPTATDGAASTWQIRGGHRLWYAPEDPVTSYQPDNDPVAVRHEGLCVTLTQDPEALTGIVKSLSITLAERGTAVTVHHQLENRGSQRRQLAPWALSVMTRGGEAFVPQPRFVPHPEALLPARTLVLWPFTQMDDPRWSWGAAFVRLRQRAELAATQKEAQKVGLYNESGWLAYRFESQLFVKRHPVKPGAHADRGCNAELFTNRSFLEIESLGPLVELQPGEAVGHDERWQLATLEAGEDDEDRVKRTVLALLTREFEDEG